MIRYGPQLAGRSVKCPKCQYALVVPKNQSDPSEDEIVLGGPEDEDLAPTLSNPNAAFCRNCGKKVKAGVTKCKRCRDEASAQLAARMKSESAFDRAMVSQAQFYAKRRDRNGLPTPLYVLLVVLTLGMWVPLIYFLNRRDDDDNKSTSSSAASGRK